jgi:hypothetical protein
MQRFTILGRPALVDHGVSFREALRLLINEEQAGKKLPASGVEVRHTEDGLKWRPCKVAPLPDELFTWEPEVKTHVYRWRK